MADTSTTGDRKRRSVTKSEFFTDADQLEWLKKLNAHSNERLIEDLKGVHARLFHDVFVVPQTSEHGREANRRRNEAIEDIATILKGRGALPPQFKAYALDPQELPWIQNSPISDSERSRN